MWTDSSAKQKSIGLLADGWGSTLSQTLSLCSRPVRHPSCEWTHCAHSVSLCVNSLPPLIMCEEGKSSLSGQSGTSSLLKLWGYSNYLWATDLGLFFPFYSNLHRHSAIPLPLYKTRGDCCTCLRWQLWCICGPLFLRYFVLYRQSGRMQVSKSYYRRSKTTSSPCKPSRCVRQNTVNITLFGTAIVLELIFYQSFPYSL